MKKTPYIDKEEQQIIESLEKGEWTNIKGKRLEKLQTFLSDAAKEALNLKKKQQISLNLERRDIMFVKEKANQTGIPYQKIISYLVKQYREGKITLHL